MSAAHFSESWLRQREPFDAAARDRAAQQLQLESRLRAIRPGAGQAKDLPNHLPKNGLNGKSGTLSKSQPSNAPWRVIDLACGTGSNLRWLASRLGGTQEWLVVDHDEKLLRAWPRHLGVSGSTALHKPLYWSGTSFEVAVIRQRVDLMTELDRLPWASAHLVAASALLDLVGQEWMKRLVAQVVRHRLPLLMSLNVDGRHHWSIEDESDAVVERLFAQHQRREKGMGAALGADAVPVLAALLAAEGYRVETAASDWEVDGVSDPAAWRLQRALISGIAAAAVEQDATQRQAISAWQQRRLSLCAQTFLRVGHIDVWATPS